MGPYKKTKKAATSIGVYTKKKTKTEATLEVQQNKEKIRKKEQTRRRAIEK